MFSKVGAIRKNWSLRAWAMCDARVLRVLRIVRVTCPTGLVWLACLSLPAAALPLQAQSAAPTPLARAESLALRGDSTKARALVDSILADTDPDATPYADALYWRGAFAGAPLEQRKDLLRVIVEYPFSSHAGDALFRLATAENASGDRQAAERHLELLVRDHAGSAFGAQGAFELGRMLMTDGMARPACAALDSALAYEPSVNVETRNQIAYASRPCDRLHDVRNDTAATSRDSAPPNAARHAGRGREAPGKQTASTGRGSAGRAPTSTSGTRWSVQVAAFSSRPDAIALAERLKARGYDTRVTPENPFRVRIGRYATLGAVAAVAEKLKAEKTTAIIVEAERP